MPGDGLRKIRIYLALGVIPEELASARRDEGGLNVGEEANVYLTMRVVGSPRESGRVRGKSPAS